jgi:GDP-4-dehydro-6-deoxy-D-mannose reductase
MKKALVTGAEGFVGPHLMAELIANDYQVIGTSRIRQSNFVKMDLLNYEEVRSVINELKPDVIFHLAGIAFVPSSWQDPDLTFQVNTIGALHIFNACRSVGINPVIQIACSSEEYGLVHENEVPIKETNPLRPLSPYAVSKIAMDFLGYQYNQSYGMKIIRTRAFNHSGPGRGEAYMTSTFAKQIAQIELGLQEPVIMVGDLSSIRDITDVRDTVNAYRLLTEKGTPGEVYNIATGTGYTAEEILNKLLSMTTYKKKIEIKQDPKRMRPSDVKILIGSNKKTKKACGWSPKHKIDDTLESLLNYWRSALKEEK